MYGNPPQGQDLMEPFEPSGYRIPRKDLPAGPGFFDKQFVIPKNALWLIFGLSAVMWYKKKK